MLSICVTVKNRSLIRVDDRELRLFPNCVQSVVQAVDASVDCELVVADWQSDDWPLNQWLTDRVAGQIPLHVLNLEGAFSRGRGRNAAAEAAQGSTLFFLDADCLINRQVLCRGIEVVSQGSAFFPVVTSYRSPNHQECYWRGDGYGNCFLSRATYRQSGGWPELESWGQEDTDFHDRVGRRVKVVREQCEGLRHQWHPDDSLWKDRCSVVGDYLTQERARIQACLLTLTRILPSSSSVLLVDEARFCLDKPAGWRLWPFLERDGVYWGTPSDDRTAVAELERMRRLGADYAVFAWISFWWLEHYQGLREHLQIHYRLMFQDDSLLVFDLRQQTPEVAC